MERRKFLTGAAVGAGAAALASPAISGGHTKVMTSFQRGHEISRAWVFLHNVFVNV